VANGSVAQTTATPSIFNDGTLYNLIWLDPTGAVRFATSRDTTSWAVQSGPLTTLPPNSQPALMQRSGRCLAAFNNGGAISIVDLSNTARARVTVTQGAIGPVAVANDANGFVLASNGDHNIPDRDPSCVWTPVDGASLGHGPCWKSYAGNVVSRVSSTGPPTAK
jgi:hypothetical protein